MKVNHIHTLNDALDKTVQAIDEHIQRLEAQIIEARDLRDHLVKVAARDSIFMKPQQLTRPGNVTHIHDQFEQDIRDAVDLNLGDREKEKSNG